MKEIIQIDDTLFRIPIPLPFPLRWLYAYAIKGNNGWTIIDTGLNREETHQVWQRFLLAQKSDWSEIEQIILTHYHPDHYGAAGWLQEKSGAPVFISKIDHETANLFWHAEEEDMGRLMKHFYLQHGMPVSLAEKMISHMHEFISWVTPKPEVTFIEQDDTIYLGNEPYHVIATPGHSDGHLCFYQPERKVLFSGDHILNKITPNVSLWPKGTDRNPLKRFISSLEKIASYEIKVAYPAHKSIITDVNKRIKELFDHHEERLKQVITWVGEKATGYEVCEKMFGKDLSIHQLRFAMAETLAHLVYLEGEGKLSSQKEGHVVGWMPNHLEK